MSAPVDEPAKRPTGDPLSMDYQQFVEQWCSGQEPAHGPDAQRLLAVVARIVPSAYQRLAEGPSWGPLTMAPIVELGAVIDAAEPMPGSGPVLARLAAGDPAARSELEVARFLAARDLIVELEPELFGRKPDFRIVEPYLVYGEVVTPELSAPARALSHAIAAALSVLVEHTPWGGRLEVVMSSDGDPAQVADWLAPRIGDVVTDHSAIDVPLAYASFSLTQIDPAVGPQIGGTLDLPSPALAAALVQHRDGAARTAVLRASITDDRAGKILDAEAKHFTRDRPTLVVIDTGGGPFSSKGWSPLLQRRFQPEINTRFSAAGLFRRSLHLDASHGTDWTMLTNPHARNPLPKAVADLLASTGSA